MVRKDKLKARAIGLRKRGLSYSEILNEVPVARSTLSLWLRSIGLAKRQKQKITEKRIAGRLRAIESIKQKRIIKSELIRKEAIGEVKQLIKDPVWLTGVILYWAEGTKQKEWNISEAISFINMDTETHRIFINWSKKYLGVNKRAFKYYIYIHRGFSVDKAKKYWSDNLNIPTDKIKVYFKKVNNKPVRKNIGDNYNGILKISINGSTDLNRKIAGWTEGVIKYLR